MQSTYFAYTPSILARKSATRPPHGPGPGPIFLNPQPLPPDHNRD